MNTKEKTAEEIKFRNVVEELRIPDYYNAVPAEIELTIEFIVEIY